MVKALNTVTEMEMADGSKVRLTVNYYWLKQLSSKNKAAYQAFCAAQRKTADDIEDLDLVMRLYAAYLCACLMDGTYDDAMAEDDFLLAMSTDQKTLIDVTAALFAPKAAGASS